MADSRVLIFAGTTEGRKLTEYLAGHAVRVHACTATEYGRSLLPEGTNVTVSGRRMDGGQMERLMREFQPEYVVDATHPYADEASRNIREACGRCRRTYLRLVRESSPADGCIYADDLAGAVAFLKETKGNILAATGSKELEAYTELEDYKERLYARVLSVADVAEKCERLGIKGRHLICMQGPFSAEMNAAMLREFKIAWFVTKESGKAGGFPEKYEAAKSTGATLIVIGRPKETKGYTFKEMCGLFKEKLGLSDRTASGQETLPAAIGAEDYREVLSTAIGAGDCREVLSADAGTERRRKVSLVGIGTGSQDYLTVRGRECLRQADLIIGAERVVKAAALDRQDICRSYRPAEIVDYIKAHTEYKNIAVALSGDVGFYSGAKGILAALAGDKDSEPEVEVVPGISSVIYFCAKLHIPWEDAALVSMHGKKAHVVSAVRDHKKTIVLVSSGKEIKALGAGMAAYGYGGLTVFAGSSLSYEDERIVKLTVEELSGYDGSDLAVLCILNPGGGACRLGGIPDAAFIRGNVPMTKEEVRSVSIAKLCLKRDSVVYDIGAGTGSVAVEAALRTVQGTVYAIEAREEAVALIEENRKKFKTDNLYIVKGKAPEALDGLPAADSVFIGGSGGKLAEILFKLAEACRKMAGETFGIEKRSPCTHIVINAISLETLTEAVRCLRELKDRKEIRIAGEEIVQISVAKSKHMGDHHMMMGNNPVFVISFQVSPASVAAEG